MDPKIYQQIQKEYGKKFVALLDDKVLACGSIFEELISEVEKMGLKEEKLVFEHIDPTEATVSIGRLDR